MSSNETSNDSSYASGNIHSPAPILPRNNPDGYNNEELEYVNYQNTDLPEIDEDISSNDYSNSSGNRSPSINSDGNNDEDLEPDTNYQNADQPGIEGDDDDGDDDIFLDAENGVSNIMIIL
jgi:hypothetical protein